MIERRGITVGYVLVLEHTRLDSDPETAWEYVTRPWFGPVTSRRQRSALRLERAQAHALARLYNRDRRVGPMRVRRLWRRP